MRKLLPAINKYQSIYKNRNREIFSKNPIAFSTNIFQFLLIVFFVFASFLGWGQSITFDSPGANQFTIPCGVNSINVKVWGAGGGGGGDKGGGGGGGGFSETTLTVVEGTNYNLNIGAGGNGGVGTANGSNGGNSNFFTVIANGGIGGQTTDPPNFSGLGGIGGTGSTANGNIGINKSGNNGGAGGSSGSSTYASGGNGGDNGANGASGLNGRIEITYIAGTPPTLTNVGDINLFTIAGLCNNSVSYGFGTTGSTPITIFPSIPSGSTFNLGTTPVTVFARNSCGDSPTYTLCPMLGRPYNQQQTNRKN